MDSKLLIQTGHYIKENSTWTHSEPLHVRITILGFYQNAVILLATLLHIY